VTEVPSPTGGIAVVKRPACDCSTAPGFGGRFCHLRSVRCPNPLSAVRECYNGGTCPEASAGGNALCRCPRGYAGDQCEVDMGGSLAAPEGADRARSAGWGGGPGKGVGALTREQELALLAQQGVDVNGDGMPGWQVALIVVGSAFGAVALVAGLLAIAVHRRRSEQDRLTAEHNARRRMRRNGGGGGNSTSGGGGSRKAPLSNDEEQPGANGGLPMARGAATAPVSSPLASGLKPPSRAAELW
jgi:hypothetical protein